MKRREFLQRGLAAGLALAAGPPTAGADTAGLTGRVVRPGQADYDDARQDYNARLSRTPAAVVFCRSAADVGTAIRWARANHVPLRARCGGHSYEGYSLVDGGIVVDVSEMDGVQFDPATGTVRVGAGLRLMALTEALWPHRVAVPGGSCATVGLAGSALGGGYGLLARHLGLTCDSLREVSLVMADGNTLQADASRHPDLLWACRGGGGGNFGIATEFVFQTHPIHQVAVYSLTWDWADFAAVLRAWQAWAPTVDSRLTCALKLMSEKNGTLVSLGQFVGPAAELTALLQPLRRAGTPTGMAVKTVNFLAAAQIFAGRTPDDAVGPVHVQAAHTQFKATSDYADRPLSPDAVTTLRHFLTTAPSPSSLVQLENYGGAIDHVAPTATAFPHRAGTLFGLQYQAYWNRAQTATAPANIAWANTFRRAMQPFVSGRAYVNYCDADLPDWAQAYYGPNLARLSQIKARHDPGDFFHFPQSVPPADTAKAGEEYTRRPPVHPPNAAVKR